MPSHFLVLHALRNYFEVDLLHSLPKDRGETDQSVVPYILLENGHNI